MPDEENLRKLLDYAEAWRDGFQMAINLFRDWADKFGGESADTIKIAADMVEMTKPPSE